MPVTSRQIMEALLIKTVKTLTRWHQQGLIPAPTVELHPGGIGRVGTWPDWVLQHCKVIKQLTDQKQTLRQIAATFGSDWDAISRRYNPPPVAAATQQQEREDELWQLRESIIDVLVTQLVSSRRQLQHLTLPVAAQEVAVQGVNLVLEGYSPVLVVTWDRIVVVPDFVLAFNLAEYPEEMEPFYVLPLFGLIKRHVRNRKIPERPQVRAVNRTAESTWEGTVTRTIDLIRPWVFRTHSRRVNRRRI